MDENEEDDKEEVVCELCNDTGVIEVMGDGDNFEWDVIGTKPCICTEN